jgi:translation initiation factor 3 subunit E
MVDFAKEEYEKNKVAVPAELKEKRGALVAEHKSLSSKTAQLRALLDNVELMGKLKSQNNFNLDYLSKNHSVTLENVEDLFKFARFHFDTGNYSQAGEYLAFFKALVPDTHADVLGSLWGKLASEILLQDWSNAHEDLLRIKEILEVGKGFDNTMAALQMTNRVWLLHWALFVYFAQADGLNKFIDLAMTENFTNAIQTTAPHLLRYLTVAFIVSNQRRYALRDLVRIVEQEAPAYSDPVTAFLFSLCVDYDFEAAQTHLKEAEKVLRGDYFLNGVADTFLENARLLVFKSFCKIHRSIDLDMLSSKLGMNASEAESYIVNLVRNEQEAKIDSAKNEIVFKPSSTSIYQKIIENSSTLSTRTALLQAQLERNNKRV